MSDAESARPPLAFDRKAASYDTHAHVQRDTAAWVAEWLPARGSFTTCLEFGAGTGNLTRHLRSRFSMLEASDHAPGMVTQGRHTFPDVNWSQRDAWNPDSPSGKWDFVTSCSLLQWATDPIDVLSRWRRVLRPGGRLLSGIYIAPSLPEFGALMPDRRPFPWRTADEWQHSFKEAGFYLIKVETHTREYLYPNARALMRQLHGTGATVMGAPLPSGRMVRLLHDYDRVHARPGGVPATWTFCRIQGTA
jgi:malonyl-CoA O-methyltransferase